MTREEIKNIVCHVFHFYEVNADSCNWTDMNEACGKIIKALEQESVFDKIRAEIIDTGAYEQEVNGKTEFLRGINYCLGIIDKCKSESEE